MYNTDGPFLAERHNCIPSHRRAALDEVLGLIRQWKYFSLDPPGQSRKTSAPLALQDLLSGSAKAD